MIMSFLTSVNWITILLIAVFVIPILSGMIRPFSSDRIQNSFLSLFSYLELIVSIILSIHLSKVILSHEDNFKYLYKMLPQTQSFISSKNILVQIVFTLIFMFVIHGFLRLISYPVFRFMIEPFSILLSSAVNSMNRILKCIIGGIWQIPKSICLVLIISMGISFSSYFISNTILTDWIHQSSTYQMIDNHVIGPLLKSGIAKKIPVILNDSFQQTAEGLTEQAKKALVFQYFNGTTLNEAVKSNTEIDTTAKEIVGTVSNDKKKAYLIYQWICKNITYDNNKLKIITTDPTKVSSGAIIAYSTKSGICFDYSCLYVAMCRAVDVKVRFIAGSAYSGTAWGDHAWNQIYCSSEDGWINVDTTFGSTGSNYFDQSNFNADHSDGTVEGEW